MGEMALHLNPTTGAKDENSAHLLISGVTNAALKCQSTYCEDMGQGQMRENFPSATGKRYSKRGKERPPWLVSISCASDYFTTS